MKKIIFLIAAVAVVHFVSAQSAGIKLGGSLSDYMRNYDVSEHRKGGLGWQAGITAQYPITRSISVRGDISFVQKGDRRTESDPEYKEVFRVNYGEIFVGPSVSFESAYIFGGPYIALALSGEQTTQYNDGTSRTIDIFNTETNVFLGGYSDMLNTFDAGLKFGLGFEQQNIFGEATGGLGLSNFYNTESDWYETQKLLGLFEKDGEPIDSDVRVKNIWFGLSIGYRFNF